MALDVGKSIAERALNQNARTYAPDVQAAADALRAGRIDEAEPRIDAILAARPDDVDALNLKTAALNMRGAFSQALETAERAAALRPGDVRLALNLAAILTNLGRLEEALARFDDALAADPDTARALHDRGRARAATGRPAAAIADLERAAALLPTSGEIRVSLAEAQTQLGDLAAAERNLLEAERLGDRSARQNEAMGIVLAERGAYATARERFEAAIAADPNPAFPYAALVEIERRLGRPAAPAIERALRHAPVARRADGRPENTVLVLERFGERGFSTFRPTFHPHARSNFIGEMPPGRFAYVHAYVDQPISAAAAHAALDETDLIYNNFATPECAERGGASELLNFLADAGAETPVVNPPEAVFQSDRETNAATYAEARGFVFPKTMALPAPTSDALDAATRLDARRAAVLEAMRPPLILRPSGTHKGSGARLVETEAALDAALAELWKVEVYAIAYHDCGAEDGIFRRYRMAVVGDSIAPSNMHTASQWNVHGSERDDFDWEEIGLGREERTFLETPEALIGADPRTVFGPILERMPLEIYGVDFGLRRSDGAIVVFEANAAMAFTSVKLARRYPYLWPHRNALTAEIEAYFLRRIRG